MVNYKASSLIDVPWEILISEMHLQRHCQTVNLFHYTSTETAKKYIIKENEDYLDFQFTKASELLDKNEGKSIIEPYYHACGYLYDKGIINESFYELVRSIKYNDFDVSMNCWVLCFSKNGASSFLKERYAAKKCSIIGITKCFLDDAINEIQESKHSPKISINDLYYSFGNMKNEFVKILKTLFRCYRNDINSGMLTDNANELVRNIISDCLRHYSLCFKDSHYKNEEEVRIIFEPYVDFSKLSLDNDKVCFILENDRIHMRLDKNKYMYCTSNNIDCTNASDLNNTIISGDAIRKCYNKYAK